MIKKSNPGIRNQLGNVTKYTGKISKAELLEWFDDIWYEKDRKVFMAVINLLDDIEETTDISGMINSKDLLFEIKDKYNELKKRELARTFPPNLK